jgi:hypothetical protein
MVVDLPVPRSDEGVEDEPGRGDLLNGEGLIEAQSVVPARQARPVKLGDRHHAHPRSALVSAGCEQAPLGLKKRGRGVEDVALRAKTGGAVRTEVRLWGVVQRRRREHERSGDGEVGEPLGNSHPLVR